MQINFQINTIKGPFIKFNVAQKNEIHLKRGGGGQS